MKIKFPYSLKLLLILSLLISCSKEELITEYTLTTNVSPSNGGVVSISSGTFESGEIITLTTTPNENYAFKNWSGDATGVESTITVSINANVGITANFELKDTDNDGVTDDIDTCPDTPSGETVDANGCDSTYIYVPDNNFEQALIDLGYDDILDDYVLLDNIKDVTELILRRLGISSLEGIEGFVSLQYLVCDDNDLTSLDITNNTALIHLACYDNDLTNLDITNNTALIDLYCWSNQLTSLDVSNNTALTSLNCHSNDLTNLDVTNNTALTGLNCSNNILTSLDVSNTALNVLHCNGNQLTCIKVNATQLEATNDRSAWNKDSTASWALTCI